MRTLALLSVATIAGLAACFDLACARPTAPRPAELARRPMAPNATSASWANYGLDTGQSGFNRLETTLNASNVGSLTGLWQSPGSYSTGITGIVEDNGSVYIQDFDGNLGTYAVQAIDVQTGKVKWSAGFSGSPSHLAFGDGLVFAVTDNTHLCAYRVRNGTQAWCFQLQPSRYGFTTEAGPTYANGALFFTVEGAAGQPDALFSLNAKTGATNWSQTVGGFSFDDGYPPAVSSGQVHIYCSGEQGSPPKPDMGICAYDALSGSQLWMSVLSTQTNSAGMNLIVGHNGVIYYSLHVNAGSQNVQSVGAINASGSPLWSNGFAVGGGAEAPLGIATDDKSLYAQVDVPGSYSPEGLYAFGVKSGKQKWHVTLSASQGLFASIPAVANGVIYTMNADNLGAQGLMALDASNGNTLFEVNSGYGGDNAGARPIIVNGAVYATCGDSNGGICEFGLSQTKR